ncbi:MAG: type II secretion system GspH family protein [Candidatus Aminicenantes bacterium]|nr:type II secretion system GspH family protein [Candidatus Aminicenantes bacterium]
MHVKRIGYSLIEAIVALALVISIMTGVIQVIAQAAKLKNKIDQLNLMTSLLLNQLEELRCVKPVQTELLTEKEGEILDPNSDERFLCRWKWIPESPQAYRIEIQISSTSYPQKKLEATLWILPMLGF